MKSNFFILFFLNKIIVFIKKNTILFLTLIFLTSLFCLLYTKYLITKTSFEINKTKIKIEEQIILQQNLKIILQKKLSIDNLKNISQRYMPEYSYTNSSRIITKKEKPESTENNN